MPLTYVNGRYTAMGDGYGDRYPAELEAEVVSTVDVLDGLGDPIGFADTLNWDCTRDVTPIRQLSAKSAGRIIMLVPGFETNTLDMNGYSLFMLADNERRLFANKIAQESGFNTLMGQGAPFQISEWRQHPRSLKGAKTTFYFCMLSSMNLNRVIGTVITTDNAKATVAFVESKLVSV